MIIQDNAIFIADAHYNHKRTQLHKLLVMLQNETLQCTQIFLMGDIFDFLSSEIEYFKLINYKITSSINDLSLTHEIIYLEGNHDFNLKDLFPNVNVIPREKQPIIIESDKKKIALAHGDIFTPFFYNVYTSVIRNHYFMKLINYIDQEHFLSKKVEEKLLNKKICHKQNNFLHFVQDRIKKYNTLLKVDLVIEGHFHQGSQCKQYINIPSLACDNRYMVYQNNQFSFNTL
jgi:UDP-2,3-diacylglucosamine hydrolase